MDKVNLFLANAKKSLTVWALSLLAILAQFQPVLDAVGQVVGSISPAKAALITAAVGILARARTLVKAVSDAITAEPAADQAADKDPPA